MYSPQLTTLALDPKASNIFENCPPFPTLGRNQMISELVCLAGNCFLYPVGVFCIHLDLFVFRGDLQ